MLAAEIYHTLSSPLTFLYNHQFDIVDYYGKISSSFNLKSLRFNKWEFKFNNVTKRKQELTDVVELLRRINKRVEQNKSILSDYIVINQVSTKNFFMTQFHRNNPMLPLINKKCQKKSFIFKNLPILPNLCSERRKLIRSQSPKDIQPKQYGKGE